jgi:hypothetical protein
VAYEWEQKGKTCYMLGLELAKIVELLVPVVELASMEVAVAAEAHAAAAVAVAVAVGSEDA